MLQEENFGLHGKMDVNLKVIIIIVQKNIDLQQRTLLVPSQKEVNGYLKV